jgi:hypothetical protein
LLVQAVLLGSAILMPLSDMLDSPGYATFFSTVFVALVWMLALASLLHVMIVTGEVSLTHATAHARLAIWEMMRGRYRNAFWVGLVLSTIGGALPFAALIGFPFAAMLGSLLALIGMALYEHAYVQAGQSVPLA